jgi:hypothetical protein
MEMITIKIKPIPTDEERERIRQIVAYYRGSAHFSEFGTIAIHPKLEFNFNGLMVTLKTSGFDVKIIEIENQ